MGIRHIAAALDTEGLDPTAKLILVCLADRMNDDHGGYCWPSMDTIAKTVGINRRNTINHIQALESGGVIEMVRTPGKPSKYRLAQGGVARDTGVAHDTGTRVARDTGGVSRATPEPERTRTKPEQPWSRTADTLPAARPVADVLADQDTYR